MDQVSLPMRIALLAVLAFAGVWLVVLRPKPVEESGPAPAPVAQSPAPGVAGAPAGAQDAVDNANGSAAATEAAAEATSNGTAAAKPADPAATKAPQAVAKPATPAATPAEAGTDRAAAEKTGPAAKILADLDRRKVVVLLFWYPEGSDDREVRRAVSGIDRHAGKVKVHVARTTDIGAYEKITRGLPVVTSPSVLVIDRDKRARVISGLTIRSEIDQAVTLALRGK